MEAVESGLFPSRSGWISRLVEVLQPASTRADQLGSLELFSGLPYSDLEFAAGLIRETLVERGTRMTVQGRPAPRLWLILEGEALVSADARPIRVAARGDLVGLVSMLRAVESPETAIAISTIRAFEADLDGFSRLMVRRPIRRRLVLASAAVTAWPSRPQPRGRRSPATNISPGS